jgi:hypothetical protein
MGQNRQSDRQAKAGRKAERWTGGKKADLKHDRLTDRKKKFVKQEAEMNMIIDHDYNFYNIKLLLRSPLQT